jgi:hypothetical protein
MDEELKEALEAELINLAYARQLADERLFNLRRLLRLDAENQAIPRHLALVKYEGGEG